jgi:hypothetical protein
MTNPITCPHCGKAFDMLSSGEWIIVTSSACPKAHRAWKYMKQDKDWILKLRAKHHDALKAMLPAGDTRSGLEVWRKLRRVEQEAGAGAVAYCNGEALVRYQGKRRLEWDFHRDENAWELFVARIRAKVHNVFGYTPKGFFVNGDPRGWALKLEPKSVPFDLHRDMGGYQILAPVIE